MKLYHGSDMEVQTPKILPRLRALDFGAGFYLTSDKDQAAKWAQAVAKRRGSDNAVVNQYEFDQDGIKDLSILQFDAANAEWLDFVVANRKYLPIVEKYDLVIGPIADDATLPVIEDYMSGRYTKEIAIALLKPQVLQDQYAFLSESALLTLSFEESERVI